MLKRNLLLTLFIVVFYFASFSQEGNLGTGLQFDQERYESIEMSAPLVSRSFEKLPSKFSIKGYAPTPGNQGAQGSCVGWSSAYGARTIANAVKNGWENNLTKINQNTFSPSFVYNQIRVNNLCQGAFIEDAMKILNVKGASKLTEFPYDSRNCTKPPTNSTLTSAQNHKILTFERLARWNNPYNLVKKVKKAIANKNPVVIGLFKFNSLKTDFNNVWVSNYGKKGHAMVVVGYDDNKMGGAFEIMNSWGTRFGQNGFFWIKYSDFQRQVKTAYVLIDKNKDTNNDTNNNPIVSNTLGGELRLELSNGQNMPISLSKDANRGFNIVKSSKTTYKVNKSYSSGTQFRIYLKSKQRGYVYLIGYSGADKAAEKLYPFDKFSPFFNYSNSEIALPNEDYFIEFDNKPGQDILCVLFSKEKLNITNLLSNAKYNSGDFVTKIKTALQKHTYNGANVNFNSNKIAFSAKSNKSTDKIVPIFIAMNHK